MTKLKATLDYFNEDSIGYIEDNNPETLADKIYELYLDEKMRRNFASNALEAYSHINWEIMKKRYLTVINGLLEG